MRILDLADLPHRPIEAHGSRGFSIGAFGISADAHLVAVSLAPGGTIGRHPAAGRQLLVVLSGEAEVSGDQRVRRHPRERVERGAASYGLERVASDDGVAFERSEGGGPAVNELVVWRSARRHASVAGGT